jgi:CRP/FNR family transcriptional regulator, cyclic AMP receptor protein
LAGQGFCRAGGQFKNGFIVSEQANIARHAESNLSVARLFRDASDPNCQQLLSATPVIHLKKDQRLFERGDPGGAMYIVQSGRIEISVLTEVGRKISFNMIGAGHCFGEISMVDNQLRTASAIALEDTSLRSISRAKFFEVAKGCPELMINLLEILCERVRWMNDSVEDYALLSLHRRLARRLHVLKENFTDADGKINIAQSDLADFAGATREATNKILMQWKSMGLIKLERRSIHLIEAEKLEKIAYGSED